MVTAPPPKASAFLVVCRSEAEISLYRGCRELQSIMTSEDRKKITQWAESLSKEVRLGLIVTQDNRSQTLRMFCDHFTQMVPKLQVIEEDPNGSALPSLHLQNIRYHAVPTGKELELFLQALDQSNNPAEPLSPSIRDHLTGLKTPAPIKIFITAECPFCPSTVQPLIALASANDHIKLTIIDGVMFPEMVKADKIQSAPTVILDDHFRWDGSVTTDEIVEVIVHRDPARLSTASLRGMLKEGLAFQVAQMMLNHQTIIPGFLPLLIHAKWPVRLGAMVVFEIIAESDRPLTAQMTSFLWRHYQEVEDRVKGDLIYLLGKSGNPEVIPHLKSVLSGTPDDEIKEAVLEALESFRQMS